MTQIQQTDEVFIKTLKLLNKKFPGVDLTRPSFIGLVFLTAEKSLQPNIVTRDEKDLNYRNV